jgi:prepilin-type processing-associated H-X9-DG protein
MLKRERLLTPIEILLVVGILAVLAGLVVSTLDERSERGRASVCVSHLHQLHKAFSMYQEDWHGAFPANSPQTRHYYGWESPWPLQVAGYVKNRSAFRCPDDSSYIPPQLDAYRTWGHVTSYQMNQAIGWKHPPWDGVPMALTHSAIPAPENTMLLADRELWHFTRSRRNTHLNILFVDGHTAQRTEEEFRNGYWGQIEVKPTRGR